MIRTFIGGLAALLRSNFAFGQEEDKDSSRFSRLAHASRAVVEPMEARQLLSAAVAEVAFDPPPAVHVTAAKARPRLDAPAKLTARSLNATRVRLAWKGADPGANRVLIYAKAPRTTKSTSPGQWVRVDVVSAKKRQFNVGGLEPGAAYYFRVRVAGRSGVSGFSRMVRATTPEAAPTKSRVDYNGAFVITEGGTYTGNWESLNPNVPAVSIQTDEPVIIDGATIRSRGTLIESYGNAANITVINTTGYGLNPNVRGRYPGRFLDVDGFVSVRVENCRLESNSGIYLYNYIGNHTADETVKILRNTALNIDGRFSDGKGGFLTGPDDNYYVQFFQTNRLHGMVGMEVAWNQVVNEPGRSRVEDNISIFDTTGRANSPILIHDNYIQGAYPARPSSDRSYTGGGIMLSDVGSSHIRAYDNQVISTANYGIAISSGSNNYFYDNRIISSGLLPDGTPIASQNVGAYIWNMNAENGFGGNRGTGNLIGWNLGNGRNDSWTPDASGWVGNTAMSGQITLATEAAEFARWQQKLAASGIEVGPQ